MWRCAAGWALASLVFLGAYLAGGKEGPCWHETDFARSFDANAVDFRVQERAFPPGQGCVAVAPSGREIGSVMYPRPLEWLLVLAAFVSPFAVTAVWRRLRPKGQARGRGSGARP